jgi:hypothetical protein
LKSDSVASTIHSRVSLRREEGEASEVELDLFRRNGAQRSRASVASISRRKIFENRIGELGERNTVSIEKG